jgi:hypothetical protein
VSLSVSLEDLELPDVLPALGGVWSISLDQEHLEADALEFFGFFSLAVARKDTVAILIFGNFVFRVLFEVDCVAESTSHVFIKPKCFLEPGPTDVTFVHCPWAAGSENAIRSC